jgi:peptidoglycan/xylan/chitin deacetylase (PgdA/CDA1 family)
VRAILMYHSIDDSGSPISVGRDAFRAHLRWLVEGRVRVVPLGELMAGDPAVDAVALTFDDAFANFATEAAPLLVEHRLPVTLFVVSDRVGLTNAWGGYEAAGIPTLPLLDWAALGRLAESGITLGGHTRTHPRLSGLDGPALNDEIVGSAAAIQAECGVRPAAFAYPYGAYDGAAADMVAATYRIGCTTELRVLGKAEKSHLLPRLDMYYFQRHGRLEAWGDRSFHWRLLIRARARAIRQAFMPAWKGRP